MLYVIHNRKMSRDLKRFIFQSDHKLIMYFVTSGLATSDRNVDNVEKSNFVTSYAISKYTYLYLIV